MTSLCLALKVGKTILDEDVAGHDQEQPVDNPMNAVDRLVERFKLPLEGANAELDEIHCELESHAGQFISANFGLPVSLVTTFNAPNASVV
jgi:hypothetical protein